MGDQLKVVHAWTIYKKRLGKNFAKFGKILTFIRNSKILVILRYKIGSVNHFASINIILWFNNVIDNQIWAFLFQFMDPKQLRT